MIAFGCVSTDERRFRIGAMRAIEDVAEPSSLLMRRHDDSTTDRGTERAALYDSMLEDAARDDRVEALVLLDESTSRLAPELPAILRGLLAASPAVAVIGTAPGDGAREVESVGGALLALSPWATRELHCDPQVAAASDAMATDLCLQARARRQRVVACGSLVLDRLPQPERVPASRQAVLRASIALQRKWRTPPGSALTAQ